MIFSKPASQASALAAFMAALTACFFSSVVGSACAMFAAINAEAASNTAKARAEKMFSFVVLGKSLQSNVNRSGGLRPNRLKSAAIG
ncbi:hypothetical protein ACG2K1_07885 [Neisseria sp. 23W00296]|uniref:hypothetical protein n=1 Tax=unclassified Neisseria TaxID=2623750 RepID=UPI003758171F